jgi:hypothetical protein
MPTHPRNEPQHVRPGVYDGPKGVWGRKSAPGTASGGTIPGLDVIARSCTGRGHLACNAEESSKMGGTHVRPRAEENEGREDGQVDDPRQRHLEPWE